MLSIWETVTWNVARAGGFTAFFLLTLAVALGLALSSHLQSNRWLRLINNELHNFVTLLALIFTGVHVLAVWLDPFTKFGWNEMLIPLASHYRPVWMALGIVGLYIGLAIGLSTLLRPLIGYVWWRRLHVLTLLLYAAVVVHGIASGTDTRTWWGSAIYAFSVLLIGGLLLTRLVRPTGAPQSRSHPVLALATVILVAAGTFWAVLGPLQPGWAASAATQSSTTTAATQTVFPQSFTGNLQGQMTQSSSRFNGDVSIRLNMAISNGPAGNVQVWLRGQVANDNTLSITSSSVVLLNNAGQPLYTGSLTQFDASDQWNMTAALTSTTDNSSQLQVQLKLQVSNSGQVSGTITGGSGADSSTNGSL
ncbi:ferric reductase-like transmembrane domain-containing protein [Dictyobacter formicarum]|uniref:Ferric oxidoreductase domain-containing protein n=1 Tax=Dictyobacter formicarum TaxID=2778368 RepID=A0ABQ3VID6_9CHLR|nr:ferric reductase-like transmembrane domain-containing protein [Dictyobacter formicarum]GHO85545.1 hypothetical protein KSZ_35510 [Dictyobacter formicarum]